MTLIPCPECKADVSDRAASCPRCGHPLAAEVAGPAPQEPRAAPGRRSGGGLSCLQGCAIVLAILVGAIALLALVGSLIGPGPSGLTGPPSTAGRGIPTTAVGRSGVAKADLGRRPFSFSSQGQAQELLRLIETTPDKALYAISYRTDEDLVTLEADFTMNTLVRAHRYHVGGRCTAETWSGYVLDRIRAAAGGGTMNHTPTGTSFGAMRSC